MIKYKEVSIFYSNITTWGPQAKSFLEKEKSQILMLNEHHLDERRMEAELKVISSWKRLSLFSYAARQGSHTAATSGGQMILPKLHLGCSKLERSLLDQVLPLEQQQVPRWTA